MLRETTVIPGQPRSPSQTNTQPPVKQSSMLSAARGAQVKMPLGKGHKTGGVGEEMRARSSQRGLLRAKLIPPRVWLCPHHPWKLDADRPGLAPACRGRPQGEPSPAFRGPAAPFSRSSRPGPTPTPAPHRRPAPPRMRTGLSAARPARALRACAGAAPAAHAALRHEQRMRAARPDARPLQSSCALSCPTLSARPPAGPGLSPPCRCAPGPFGARVPLHFAPAEVAVPLTVLGRQRASAPRVLVSQRSAESARKDQAFIGTAVGGGPAAPSPPTPPRGPRGWRFPEERRHRAPPSSSRRPGPPPLRHAQRQPRRRAPPAAPAARRPRPRASRAGPGAGRGTGEVWGSAALRGRGRPGRTGTGVGGAEGTGEARRGGVWRGSGGGDGPVSPARWVVSSAEEIL